jgi:hypothetical protein
MPGRKFTAQQRSSHSSKQAEYLSNFASADACDVSDAARACTRLASPNHQIN